MEAVEDDKARRYDRKGKDEPPWNCTCRWSSKMYGDFCPRHHLAGVPIDFVPLAIVTSAAQVASFLNKALALDAECISKLSTTRIRCNNYLADHRHIQARTKDGVDQTGFLGVLNGILLAAGSKEVVVMETDYQDGTQVISFGTANYEQYCSRAEKRKVD